jgi:hypothetical protein
MKNPKSAQLSVDDLRFLVALNASEESFLFQLLWEIEGRLSESEHDNALHLARGVVRELIANNIVAITRRSQKWVDSDLTTDEALEVIESDDEWGDPEKAQTDSICLLYLSPNGEEVWEQGPMYISQEREKFLMFEQCIESTRRVKAGKPISLDNKHR